MSEETIICRICSTEHLLTENILCSCGERIYLSKELRDQFLQLDRKIATLKAEAFSLSTELWLRERRRYNNSPTGITLPPGFWKGVVGTPDWVKRKREKREPRVNMAEFD